jgi:hypothetical protein
VIVQIMGENQGLEKTLEKLAELLTAKAGGVLSSHSTVSEQTQKIELPSNEIKLEGVKTIWAGQEGLCSS